EVKEPSSKEETHAVDSTEPMEAPGKGTEAKEVPASKEERESAEEKSNDSLVENEEEEEKSNLKMSVFSTNIQLPYKQGDNHEKIIPIKVKLNALGFDGIAETGNYGSFTAKRVKEFQAYYSLP
ncbi:peptidoglycan-binding domain-containing protein, partial [Pantoea sp. SIMBA_133]